MTTSTTRRRQRSRSRAITLLALAFGGVGLVNLGRAAQSYLNVSLLAGWEVSLSPWLLLAFSVVWAALFLAAAWALWRRRGWGRRLGLWLPPAYGLLNSGQILLFTRAPYARGRWVLVALGWAVGTLVVRWTLSSARVRAQFSV